MRVELGGGDVGVAEHLLQRAQVAAAGEQVGGERVAQRVRAHPVREAGRGRVALDDLVEALARQAGAAVVDEQARLEPVADEPPAPAREVGVDGARGGGADRHDPLLGALAAGLQDPGLEVDVGGLEVDRLRRPQPARVHQLEQRAVAQRGRLGPARLLEQLRDLVAARARAAAAGSASARAGWPSGRSSRMPCAAQVAMEGAQARDLALQRRGRRPAASRRRRRPATATKPARSECVTVSASRPARYAPYCRRSER